MAESTLPFGVGELAEHQHPALVQGIEQRQRNCNRRVLGLGQFSPEIFHIRLDGGLFFGERQLEANVGVHVAVDDVMRHLAQRPATIAIGRIQLLVGKSAERGAQTGGSLLDVGQALLFLFGCDEPA